MINITIWSDFACPYCYIGERRLQDAIKELGWENNFQTDFKAFELNPDAPKVATGTIVEKLAKKYNLTLEAAKQKVDEICKLGREIGIDFRYDTAKSSNTRDAHRLMKLAEARYDRDTVEKLNETLFADYFTRNLTLADPTVLLNAATSSGLKEEDAKEVLDSNLYEEDVLKDEQEAAMRNIHGVPYIVFDNKYAVPGALSIDDFKSVLRQVFDEKTEEKLNANAKSCNGNSCEV